MTSTFSQLKTLGWRSTGFRAEVGYLMEQFRVSVENRITLCFRTTKACFHHRLYGRFPG